MNIKNITLILTFLFLAFMNIEAKGLKVLYPNGNEKILRGKAITLKWENPSYLYPLSIYYSTDNGNNWLLIARDIYTDEYKWNTPNSISDKCLFKVEAVTNGKDYTTFPSEHKARMCAVCYSPDGKYIATGSDDNNIFIFEVATQKKIATCQGHTSNVEFLDWSPDSKKLASVGRDDKLRIWDTSNWSLLKTISAPNNNLYYVEWDNNSKNIAVTGKNAILYVFDGSTGNQIAQVNTGHTNANSTLCWSSDNSFLVIGSWDAFFSVWDTKNYTEILRKGTAGDLIADVDLSYDDKYIAATTKSGSVYIYDLINNKFLPTLNHHNGKYGTVVYWNYNNYQIATSAYDGKVCIWDMNLNKIIKDYQINGEEVYDLDWDRTNGCIVAVGLTKNVNIICDTEDVTEVDSSDSVWEIYGCPELVCQNIKKDFYTTGKHILDFEIYNPTANPVEIKLIKFLNGDFINYTLLTPNLPKIIYGKEKIKGQIEFNGNRFGDFFTDLIVYTECDSNKAKISNRILCPEFEIEGNTDITHDLCKNILNIKLKNKTYENITITEINFEGIDQKYYSLSSPKLPFTLNAGATISLEVSFNPDKFRTYTTEIIVKSTCFSDTNTLTNSVLCPELIIQGNNETYGDIKTYEIPIALINDSKTDIVIKTLELIDLDGYYEVISPTVIPFTIKAKSTYTIIVKFTPDDFGVFSAKFKYSSDCDTSTFDILNVIKCMVLDPADYVKGFTNPGIYELKVPIYNPNNYPVIINDIEKTGIDKDFFEILAPSLPLEISGNSTVDIELKLTATEEREYHANFILKTFCDTSDIDVMAFIECPELVYEKEINETIRYKKHQIKFDILNPDRIAALIKDIKIVGNSKDNYAVLKPSPLPYSILPNTTLNAIINFEAKGNGDYPITIQIITDCDTFYVDINVKVDCPQLEFSNTKFNFINPDDENIITIEIFNPSILDANISKLTIYGSDKKYYEIIEPKVPFVIPAESSIILKVRFTGSENRKHEVKFAFTTDCDEQLVPIITTINCPKLEISSKEGVFYEIGENLIEIPITNPSYSYAKIQSISITGKDKSSFTLISPSTLPHLIDGESTYNLQLKLDAKNFGIYSAEIEIISECDTNNITLTYIVDCPVLEYTKNISTFDELSQSTIKVLIKNRSTFLPAVIDGIKFEGQDASAFKLISPSLPFNIPIESEIEVLVSFSPNTLKDHEAQMKLITQCNEFELSITKKVIIVTSSQPHFGNTILCEKQIQRIEFTNNYFEPLIIDLSKSQFVPNDKVFFFDTTRSTIEIAKNDTVSLPIGFKALNQGQYSTELELSTNYKPFKFYLSAEVYNIAPVATKDTTLIELSGTEKITFYTSIPGNYKGYLDSIVVEILQSNDGVHINTNTIKSDANNLKWTSKYFAVKNSNSTYTVLYGKGKLELPFEGKLFEIDYESTIDTSKITNIYFNLIYDCIEEQFRYTTVKRNSVCNDDIYDVNISDYSNNVVKVNPNPVKEYLNLNYSIAFDNTNCKIEIINILGEIVYIKDKNHSKKGKYNEVIDMQNIANGVYFISFYIGEMKSNMIINVEK